MKLEKVKKRVSNLVQQTTFWIINKKRHPIVILSSCLTNWHYYLYALFW